jgi:NADPH:quinone reductase-like Zn-dependent oxidoreductase
MRAWRIHRYGGPEQLVLEAAPLPEPREGELLVRVGAASVNPIDWRQRSGSVQAMFPVEFPRVLGRDCAGVVAESRSPDFRVGERVLGINDQKRNIGTHAQYAVVPASQATAIPPSVSDAQAVAIGNSGITAWSGIVSTAGVAEGQRVLIHAAAGGVGGIALQLARHFGAEVFGTCSARNIDYVESLGAHRAIDYGREDFTRIARDCDIVFDMVGGETHRRSFECLKPGGILLWIPAWGGDNPPPPRNDVRVLHAGVRAAADRLRAMMALVAQGALKPQIARIYPMAEAPAAYAASESGRSRGKNIIAIG